jgi:hypothetical protein
MEKISGRLEIVEKNGRFGAFRVGTLHTNIGVFKVKDKALEQFEAGAYVGDFLIEEIFIRTQPWKSGTYTEILARIAPDGFLIDTEEQPDTQVPDAPEAVEPDPVDVVQATPVEPTHDPLEVHGEQMHGDDDGQEDEALFGIELAPQFNARMSPIKLDPTVDRNKFRAQRERLKAVGYSFSTAQQEWVIKEMSHV